MRCVPNYFAIRIAALAESTEFAWSYAHGFVLIFITPPEASALSEALFASAIICRYREPHIPMRSSSFRYGADYISEPYR